MIMDNTVVNGELTQCSMFVYSEKKTNKTAPVFHLTCCQTPR